MKFRIPRLRDVDRLFRKGRVERRLTRHLPSASTGFREISIITGPTSHDAPHRFVLRKSGRALLLAFDHWAVLDEDRLVEIFSARGSILVNTFASTSSEVTEALAEISDGSESGNGIISFCSRHAGSILVPDPDFYLSGGYADIRSTAMAPGPIWTERDAAFVWRGSTTGPGLISADDMNSGDSRLIGRSRLCLALRGRPGTDVKLCQIAQSLEPGRDLKRLRAAGIFGEPIDAKTWRNRKFAIDIDGNGNAWSNLFTRLLLGCCVIKIASERGYRQWYYDALHPFEHFVPVAADLSDLAEKIEWCRAHDRECSAIAAAGQEFALRRTLAREVAATVELLNRRLQSAGGTDRRNTM